MNGADLDHAVHHQLPDTVALGAGKREVQFSCDALFEYRQMFRAADTGLDHVQVVYALRVEIGQRTREKIGLFLVVALGYHAVARANEGMQRVGYALAGQHLGVQPGGHAVHARPLVVASRRPFAFGHALSCLAVGLACAALKLECATRGFNKPAVCFVNVDFSGTGRPS